MVNNLVRRGFLNALGTTAYIAAVALFMQNIEKLAGPVDKKVLSPIVFLLVLVLSAAVTGSLVLGKPALMYVDGQKVEAVKLFLYTVGWLVLSTIIFIGLISIM